MVINQCKSSALQSKSIELKKQCLAARKSMKRHNEANASVETVFRLTP